MNVRLRSLLCLSVSRGHVRCPGGSTRTTTLTTLTPSAYSCRVAPIFLYTCTIEISSLGQCTSDKPTSDDCFFVGVGPTEKSPSAHSCRVTALYLSTCTYDEDLLGSFRLVQTAGNQTGRECRPCRKTTHTRKTNAPCVTLALVVALCTTAWTHDSDLLGSFIMHGHGSVTYGLPG